MTIESIMSVLAKPPTPANEVVPLDRATAEAILAELEANDPNRGIVVGLRLKLSAPRVELWAIHSVGPGEVYPALDREHAERMVAELDACCQREKQRIADAGESLEYWSDWVTNIIPSPWEPSEHFEELARQFIGEHQSARKGWEKARADRADLLGALHLLLEDLEERARDDEPNPGQRCYMDHARETITKVTAEEVARKARLKALAGGHKAAADSALAQVTA